MAHGLGALPHPIPDLIEFSPVLGNFASTILVHESSFGRDGIIDNIMTSVSGTADAPPRREGAAPGGMRWNVRAVRARLRLVSALVLLSFVVCHLVSHITLLVSFPVANRVLTMLMEPWRSGPGTAILLTAAFVHYANALWSIYERRYLRLSAWEWWQLGLGLCIPPLLMVHVLATRVAGELLSVDSDYIEILVLQWVVTPKYVFIQSAALLTVWTHASIGIHFWLRTKNWYPNVRGGLAAVAILIPTLALAGYVSAGNQIVREAEEPGYAIYRWAYLGFASHFALVGLTFAAVWGRRLAYRMRRPPMLTHSNGRTMPILPGATVLETLRENGIPHASVCGGRARCTTCRVMVTRGLAALPAPAVLEAKALARIEAPPGLRLACQIRPTADLTVMPLLPADATPAQCSVRGGLEGSERLITMVFVDLRGSTTLGEAKLPYDVLFILNQFFTEMTKALDATDGHYSQFTGDGLLALYGLTAKDPATGPADALRGAREMLTRLEQLNRRLVGELAQPLRIGIGMHFAEAIVGSMGPPRSQIITAIGDAVNTAARLEGLTKEYDCALVISRRAAEAAGLDLSVHQLHAVAVKGRVEKVEFYALQTIPES
ncbi:MAG: adenylate/guanylate cyclase domain-containing protein [Alphaproteobacteria bacterium]|nr:MAG: adenylate/guanylate cyclase domain-containing protein [Alphaproteobacteria bacterium]